MATLTTPFVPPAECTASWVQQLEYTHAFDVTSTVVYYSSDVEREECLPVTENVTASLAVCPASWTYYDLGVSDQLSTAFCCDVGFTLDSTHSLATDVKSTQCWYSEATPSQSTFTFGEGDWRINLWGHEPERITWASSDVSNLSPSPPTLTPGTVEPIWYPGFQLDGDDNGGNGGDSGGDNNSDRGGGISTRSEPMWFLVIGLPIIGASILACIGWSCFRRRKEKRAAAIQEFVVSSPADTGKGAPTVREFPPNPKPSDNERAIVQFVSNQAAKDKDKDKE